MRLVSPDSLSSIVFFTPPNYKLFFEVANLWFESKQKQNKGFVFSEFNKQSILIPFQKFDYNYLNRILNAFNCEWYVLSIIVDEKLLNLYFDILQTLDFQSNGNINILLSYVSLLNKINLTYDEKLKIRNLYYKNLKCDE